MDYASSPYHTPRRIEATFSFEMIINRNDFDKDEDLQYWLPLPTDWENQQNIEIISINPQPILVYDDSTKHLKIGYWDFSRLNALKQFSINIDLKADILKVDYFLDPGMVPDTYDHDQQTVAKYTQSDSLAFITQEIVELVYELTRNVSDPFLKVRDIYRWVLMHIEHPFPVIQRGRDIYSGLSIRRMRNCLKKTEKKFKPLCSISNQIFQKGG